MHTKERLSIENFDTGLIVLLVLIDTLLKKTWEFLQRSQIDSEYEIWHFVFDDVFGVF
jgi:hypothetical protein